MSGFRFDVLAEYWPLFAEGIGMTLKLTIGCVICGVFLGMLLGMARMAEARHAPWKSILYYGVRWPVTIWVSFFRGTPLFVQIFLMYFAVLPVFIHPVDGLIISAASHAKSAATTEHFSPASCDHPQRRRLHERSVPRRYPVTGQGPERSSPFRRHDLLAVYASHHPAAAFRRMLPALATTPLPF